MYKNLLKPGLISVVTCEIKISKGNQNYFKLKFKSNCKIKKKLEIIHTYVKNTKYH